MVNKVFGLLGISAKAGKIVSGTDIVIENIDKGKIKLVIIAKDAAIRTVNNFNFICNKQKIPICVYGTIEENSKSIGKVNRAVIGVEDEKLAEAIIKEISAEVE